MMAILAKAFLGRQQVAVALAFWLSLYSSVASGQGTSADYARSADLNNRTFGRVYRDRVSPHWSVDGNSFWYRSRGPDGTWQVIWVDAVAGTRKAAFDHKRLAAGIEGARGKPLDSERVPVDALDVQSDFVTVDLEGERWRVTTDAYVCTRIGGSPAAASTSPARLAAVEASAPSSVESSITFFNDGKNAVIVKGADERGSTRELFRLEAGELQVQYLYAGSVCLVMDVDSKVRAVYRAGGDPGSVVVEDQREFPTSAPTTHLANLTTAPTSPDSDRHAVPGTSPDGRWIAFVKDHSVRLREVANGHELELSRDPREGDTFSSLFWSPDSTKLVALRSRNNVRSTLSIVQSSPTDQLQPKLISFEYVRTGDETPLTKPCLFDVVSRREVPIADDLFPNPSAPYDIGWQPDSRRFHFFYSERGYHVARMIFVDAANGTPCAVVDERSDTFVDMFKWWARPLYESHELLHMSERDGWNHIYLVDCETGKLKNRVTAGSWNVRKWNDEFDWIDSHRRKIGFRAGGFVKGEDPYNIHYFTVNFDGTNLIHLTPANGTHSLNYSPDGRFYIDTYSRADMAPVSELRRSDDGGLICGLEQAITDQLQASGWRAPEPFVSKGRDGITDIYGLIYRPTNFDEFKRYPVIEDIYAGPDDNCVPKEFHRHMAAMELAELGFIVVKIDGMGTNNRSKKFLDVCWRNLGDSGFPDRIRWIRAAAAKFPFMDLTRVGIFGCSAGGYNALRALLAHGDFYTVGVSECGVHDHRLARLSPNEMWMGWPVGPWYAEQSNVANASKLKGKLLLIVSELDRTVDPSATMQTVNALIKANRDFDLLVVPNADHCEGGSYTERRIQDFFVRQLLHVEPRN